MGECIKCRKLPADCNCPRRKHIHSVFNKGLMRTPHILDSEKTQWVLLAQKRPYADQVVRVLNRNLKNMRPHKAFYDEASGEFLSLEITENTPISVTHWMDAKERPKWNG